MGVVKRVWLRGCGKGCAVNPVISVMKGDQLAELQVGISLFSVCTHRNNTHPQSAPRDLTVN